MWVCINVAGCEWPRPTPWCVIWLVLPELDNILTRSHQRWLCGIITSLPVPFHSLAVCPVWSAPGVGDKAMGSRRRGYASIGPTADGLMRLWKHWPCSPAFPAVGKRKDALSGWRCVVDTWPELIDSSDMVLDEKLQRVTVYRLLPKCWWPVGLNWLNFHYSWFSNAIHTCFRLTCSLWKLHSVCW